ncbi:MAG: isoleucine--tRNA ligase [Verrucomicrobia bacterium]|nr:isoleucine--tRNA ligase [Verrucomicrobiota bacterium]
MDYKNTLNLPRTDFPMKADLVTREPERLAKWQQMDLYGRIQKARVGAEKFVLHDGPPFANGDVHIGNALNKILKDIVVKYHSLRGKSAPYIPGWDCHGLPIEFKVTQEMRKGSAAAPAAGADASPANFDAATIRTACDAYARKYIDLQRTQFKRLGILGDWENPYLTLNKEYEADELRLFADIVEKGFVYRGKKPVYWSIPCRTALAEAEVEYQDHVSQSVYVKFRVKGEPNTFIVIWTTTPWTLPANLAVAFNATFHYSLVQANGEAYLVSNALLSQVAEKCGWGGYQIIRTVYGDELATFEYEHPFCARTGKLFVGDSFVENSTGTGFVHIAPGHGLEDYQLGRQNGLPIYSPVDNDGCLALTNDLPVEQQMPVEMVGKSILEKHGKSDANVAVLHELRVRNAVLHQENYHHSYPHCWRSKTPVIFRAMDQWFIELGGGQGKHDVTPEKETVTVSQDARRELSGIRREAMLAISNVTWVPLWGKTRIQAAVMARPDWCISRQRSWGVPIPAFYDAQSNAILDARIVCAAADLIEKHGSNIWFEKSASELWALLKPKDWTGPEAATKSSDTLDVWIDSGSSSRAVLMRRPELNSKLKTQNSKLSWQADMYLEGSDQHRGWFQSSLLLSLVGNGAAPYKTVLTHGFMVDADREKISKSKQGQGSYEKPQTAEAYVKKYGADVVRLWVASQDFRNDIIVSEERINKVAETYRGIRNALRYQLSNLYDFDPAKHSVPDEKLTNLDRWILDALESVESRVQYRYEQFEFHIVYQIISQFAAVDLSARYHDAVKDRLYTLAANNPKRRSTQTTLYRLVTKLCQILSPILSFTAEEAWECIPQDRETDSIFLSTWKPSLSNEGWKSDWKNLIPLRDEVLPYLEQARQAGRIGKALDAKIKLKGRLCPALEAAEKFSEDFQELLSVSKFEGVEYCDASASGTGFLQDVIVEHADGQKCERCWHWETSVGSNLEHPTICARCVEALSPENIS